MMKQNLLKRTLMLASLTLILFASAAFVVKSTDSNCITIKDLSIVKPNTEKTASPTEDGRYFFIFIHGVYQKSKVAYVSKILYYDGYVNCNNKENYRFHIEAKNAFSKYLQAHYNDEFPYGGHQNMSISTYNKAKRQDIATEMNSWVGEQKSHGYKVVYTDFDFSCN